jgi:hypothetical protein
MDSEQHFRKNQNNCQANRLLALNDWTDTNVSYHFNSDGFRSADFNKNSGYMALGCSFTQGVGLPISQAWPWLVGYHFKLETQNLGIGSGSLDMCFRLAQYWIPRLKPKFVVLLEPDSSRIEYHDETGPKNLLVNQPNVMPDWYLKAYYAHAENAQQNRLKNVMAIEYICNKNNIPLYTWPPFIEQLSPDPPIVDDWARDLAHNGPAYNKWFANKVIAEIEQHN